MPELHPDLYRSLLELTLTPDDRRLDATLALVDADAIRIELESFRGQLARFHARDAARRDAGLAASSIVVERVLVRGRAFAVDDVASDPQLAEVECFRRADIRSFCCVPVPCDDVIGALYVHVSTGTVDRRPVDLLARALTHAAPRLLRGRRSFSAETRAFERRILVEALERHHWRIDDVALELCMGRSTLYKRIHRLGLRSACP